MNQREALLDWQKFLLAESHILKRNPALLFQQTANQPDSTAPARAALARREAGLEARPWFQYVNKPQLHSACLMTLAGHTAEVSACAFSPDGRRIVSASHDNTLKLWDSQTGVQIWEYEPRGIAKATAWSPRGGDLAASDGAGCLLILRLQNFFLGPILVTPWQFNPRRWISLGRPHSSIHIGCPLCRVWSEVPATALGAVIPCPHCGGRIKLNPFTIEADWRPIAAAWKVMSDDE